MATSLSCQSNTFLGAIDSSPRASPRVACGHYEYGRRSSCAREFPVASAIALQQAQQVPLGSGALFGPTAGYPQRTFAVNAAVYHPSAATSSPRQVREVATTPHALTPRASTTRASCFGGPPSPRTIVPSGFVGPSSHRASTHLTVVTPRAMVGKIVTAASTAHLSTSRSPRMRSSSTRGDACFSSQAPSTTMHGTRPRTFQPINSIALEARNTNSSCMDAPGNRSICKDCFTSSCATVGVEAPSDLGSSVASISLPMPRVRAPASSPFATSAAPTPSVVSRSLLDTSPRSRETDVSPRSRISSASRLADYNEQNRDHEKRAAAIDAESIEIENVLLGKLRGRATPASGSSCRPSPSGSTPRCFMPRAVTTPRVDSTPPRLAPWSSSSPRVDTDHGPGGWKDGAKSSGHERGLSGRLAPEFLAALLDAELDHSESAKRKRGPEGCPSDISTSSRRLVGPECRMESGRLRLREASATFFGPGTSDSFLFGASKELQVPSVPSFQNSAQTTDEKTASKMAFNTTRMAKAACDRQHPADAQVPTVLSFQNTAEAMDAKTGSDTASKPIMMAEASCDRQHPAADAQATQLPKEELAEDDCPYRPDEGVDDSSDEADESNAVDDSAEDSDEYESDGEESEEEDQDHQAEEVVEVTSTPEKQFGSKVEAEKVRDPDVATKTAIIAEDLAEHAAASTSLAKKAAAVRAASQKAEAACAAAEKAAAEKEAAATMAAERAAAAKAALEKAVASAAAEKAAALEIAGEKGAFEKVEKKAVATFAAKAVASKGTAADKANQVPMKKEAVLPRVSKNRAPPPPKQVVSKLRSESGGSSSEDEVEASALHVPAEVITTFGRTAIPTLAFTPVSPEISSSVAADSSRSSSYMQMASKKVHNKIKAHSDATSTSSRRNSPERPTPPSTQPGAVWLDRTAATFSSSEQGLLTASSEWFPPIDLRDQMPRTKDGFSEVSDTLSATLREMAVAVARADASLWGSHKQEVEAGVVEVEDVASQQHESFAVTKVGHIVGTTVHASASGVVSLEAAEKRGKPTTVAAASVVPSLAAYFVARQQSTESGVGGLNLASVSEATAASTRGEVADENDDIVSGWSTNSFTAPEAASVPSSLPATPGRSNSALGGRCVASRGSGATSGGKSPRLGAAAAAWAAETSRAASSCCEGRGGLFIASADAERRRQKEAEQAFSDVAERKARDARNAENERRRREEQQIRPQTQSLSETSFSSWRGTRPPCMPMESFGDAQGSSQGRALEEDRLNGISQRPGEEDCFSTRSRRFAEEDRFSTSSRRPADEDRFSISNRRLAEDDTPSSHSWRVSRTELLSESRMYGANEDDYSAHSGHTVGIRRSGSRVASDRGGSKRCSVPSISEAGERYETKSTISYASSISKREDRKSRRSSNSTRQDSNAYDRARNGVEGVGARFGGSFLVDCALCGLQAPSNEPAGLFCNDCNARMDMLGGSEEGQSKPQRALRTRGGREPRCQRLDDAKVRQDSSSGSSCASERALVASNACGAGRDYKGGTDPPGATSGSSACMRCGSRFEPRTSSGAPTAARSGALLCSRCGGTSSRDALRGVTIA